MSSKKDSIRVLARRAQSLKNSAQFNLRIFSGQVPRTLLKKLYQVWFLHKVVLVFLLKLKTSANKTIFKSPTLKVIHRPTRPLQETITLKWECSIKVAVAECRGIWWDLETKTKCSNSSYIKAWATKDRPKSRDSRVPPWTRGFKEEFRKTQIEWN